MTQSSAPVLGKERVVSLDVLRGVAILGILLMNIVTFSMVLGAYTNPVVYGDLSGPDYWTWLTLHVLADMKFMTIFTVLFGAGVCIFMERAAAKGPSPWPLHLKRMGWLLLIGLLHAHLLWYGDILYSYAMCGFVIALMRNWRPRTLCILGGLAMCIPIAITQLLAWTMQWWPPEAMVEIAAPANLQSAQNVAEIAAYSGSYADEFSHRTVLSLTMQLFIFPIIMVWRGAGMMLVGMALWKWGILSASRSTRFYATMLSIGLAVGVFLTLMGVRAKLASNWDPVVVEWTSMAWNYVGSMFTAAAWIAAVMLVCKLELLGVARRALASVGRMAFTNYIGQTVICTTLFYGHGLGWFNTFERVELLWVVAGVWTFQIAFSVLWLRAFRFGPLEWLWRSLSYGSLQSMGR